MAINPNTDFTTGAVYTADQANRFPRGVMAYGTSTTAISFGGETTICTSNAFTAVANRYYRMTFYQPSMSNLAAGYSVMKIKNGATVINTANAQQYTAGTGFEGIVVAVTTLSAGSTTITGTLISTTTGNTNNTTTQYGFILVEDIGPA